MAKKYREGTIVTTDILDYYDTWTEAKKDYCEDNDVEECTDEEVCDWLDQIRDDDWDMFMENIPKDAMCVVQADLGLWYGRAAGGKVCKLKDLFGLIDCDDVEVIWNNTTGMIVRGSHHDGSNTYSVKVLTKKGETWYYNHYYDDRRTQVEHLWNTTGLSKQVTPWWE